MEVSLLYSSRLLLLDVHPLMREGLALAVRDVLPDIVIDGVGSIAAAEAVIPQSRDYRLVMMDIVLPDADGFSGFLKLRQMLGDVPIVIVSALRTTELVEAARLLGAAGYISKSLTREAMAAALGAVLAGAAVFSAAPVAPDRDDDTPPARIAALSGAQLRVLVALAGGRLNKQIAAELGVTEATIKAHLTAIFRKLGVANRTQAILAVQPLIGMSMGEAA